VGTATGCDRLRQPAVLLLLDVNGLPSERQNRVAFLYASTHDLAVVALVRRGRVDDAVASVRVGRAQVVLAALAPPDVAVRASLERDVEAVGGRVTYVRQTQRPPNADEAEVALIAGALTNTAGNVELVAQVLGLPVERVRLVAREALGTHRPRMRGGTTPPLPRDPRGWGQLAGQ
jgi:hypothetical protein